MMKLLLALVVLAASTGCATAGQNQPVPEKEDMELVCTKGRATGTNVKGYTCRWRESAAAERESAHMLMYRLQRNHQRR